MPSMSLDVPPSYKPETWWKAFSQAQIRNSAPLLYQKIPALDDPDVQKRILQRSPGPGFLQLDLTHDVAITILQLLKSHRANGYVIPSAYRQPGMNLGQAESIAKRVIAELHATRIPDHTLGPVHLVREEPVAWTFGAARRMGKGGPYSGYVVC